MIKQSQIFSWDEEPVEERPSAFMASTGYAPLPGHPSMKDSLRSRRSSSRFGFKSLLLFCLMVLSLGVVALLHLAPLLRG